MNFIVLSVLAFALVASAKPYSSDESMVLQDDPEDLVYAHRCKRSAVVQLSQRVSVKPLPARRAVPARIEEDNEASLFDGERKWTIRLLTFIVTAIVQRKRHRIGNDLKDMLLDMIHNRNSGGGAKPVRFHFGG